MKNIIKTRTLFGAGLTALAFSSIFTSTAFAQTCATVPTCDELGYDLSASDCTGKKALKCPFDNTKFYCPNSGEDSNQNCSVGSILYSDKTCNANVVAGKTPIGVVFNQTFRLAISLTLNTEVTAWSEEAFNILDLNDYIDSNNAQNDWNGKLNTNIALNYCKTNSKNCPAFDYVNSYSTAGTNAGDWYLPALGELNNIYKNIDILNKTLSDINADPLPQYLHWSSTENGSYNAWYQDFENGQINNYARKMAHGIYVRPVLAF